MIPECEYPPTSTANTKPPPLFSEVKLTLHFRISKASNNQIRSLKSFYQLKMRGIFYNRLNNRIILYGKKKNVQ